MAYESVINSVAWKLYIAPYVDWVLPALVKGTNDATIATAIENWFTFTRLAWVQELQSSTNFDEWKTTIECDECDIGVLTEFSLLPSTVSWTWFTAWDPNAKEIMLWTTPLLVAWTPTAVTWEALGTWWTVWTPIKLDNKNWDNTEVASIIIDADWTPLVLNTDYSVFVDSEWYTNITPLTAQAWVLDADYSYTPNATEYQTVEHWNNVIPTLIVKIVTCPDADWKTNTYYLVKSSPDWEFLTTFINPARAWDLPGSPVSFTSKLWGYLIEANSRA